MAAPGVFYVIPVELHNRVVVEAFKKREFSKEEASAISDLCEKAAMCGIRTHNAIKALSLEEHYGSTIGACVPGASISKLETKFKAVEKWNANKKHGIPVAKLAFERCMKLADEYGIGAVSVDNAFHYLWGGGYVMEAAERGYIAYTCCTSSLAEVVPYQGVYPTIGTNPHSWGFPTTDIVGFPIVVDWATSTIASGRVQQCIREGKQIPSNSAVDETGKETTDPSCVKALLPFGAHKGYGLGLIDEIYGAYIGGSLPTIRGREIPSSSNEKNCVTFYFQVIHPDSLACSFANGRTQSENVKAVLDDILGHGNEHCMLPGQPEALSLTLSKRHGGVLFTEAETNAFAQIGKEAGVEVHIGSLSKVFI